MGDLHRKIGLGTVQFGTTYGISNTAGQTTTEEVSAILRAAKSEGITLLDTASAYGNAEEVLGKNELDSFAIVSKFMPPEPGHSVEGQLLETLQKLRVSSLYGYLAHRPVHLSENFKIWKDLQNLKARGLIQKAGFSLNSPGEMQPFLDHHILPDIIQVPYNYFDRRFEKTMAVMKENGCEIHVRSAFFQGLFFMDPDELSSFFDELKPALKRFREQVKNISGTLLHFVLRNPLIDKVIIGVENHRQLIENLKSIEQAEQLPELEETFSENLLTPSKWLI